MIPNDIIPNDPRRGDVNKTSEHDPKLIQELNDAINWRKLRGEEHHTATRKLFERAVAALTLVTSAPGAQIVRKAGERTTMWAKVIEDEYEGSIRFELMEEGNRDGPHYDKCIEFAADAFPVGTRIVVFEPEDKNATPAPEPQLEVAAEPVVGKFVYQKSAIDALNDQFYDDAAEPVALPSGVSEDMRVAAWQAAYVAIHEHVGQDMGKISKTVLGQVVANAVIAALNSPSKDRS